VIPLYEDANLAISKLRKKYAEQRDSNSFRHHERKFAHHALFVLKELEKEITSLADQRGKNAKNPIFPSFWSSRKD
jgi:hypothetical protein